MCALFIGASSLLALETHTQVNRPNGALVAIVSLLFLLLALILLLLLLLVSRFASCADVAQTRRLLRWPKEASNCLRATK